MKPDLPQKDCLLQDKNAVSVHLSSHHRELVIKVGNLEGAALIRANRVRLSEILAASPLKAIERCVRADLEKGSTGVIFPTSRAVLENVRCAGSPIELAI